MPPILSIVILNWNTSKMTSDCLESIIEHTKGIEYEIVVADNGSTDDSREVIRSRFPSVKLIEAGENLGFPKGNNLGIRAAKGEFILVLNSDVLIDENAFKPVVDFLVSNPEAAGAICRITGRNGDVQPAAMRFPTMFSEWCFLSFAPVWRKKFRFPKSKFVPSLPESGSIEPREADWISGCAMMLRRSALDESGLFDEKFFLFYEDTELCHRIAKCTGKSFYYLPGSRITHLGGASFTAGDVGKTQFSFRSACYYFNKTKGLCRARLFRVWTKITWAGLLALCGAAVLVTFGRLEVFKRKFRFFAGMIATRADCMSGTT